MAGHDGTLELTDQRPENTVFTLSLPCYLQHHDPGSYNEE